MNCAECRERMVAYIEGLLNGAERGAFDAHLESCDACRAEVAETTRLCERLRTNGGRFGTTGLTASVMDTISKRPKRKMRRFEMIWRYKGRFGIAAAAAAILVTAAVMVIIERTSSPAYAIEQTVEANKAVRYVHGSTFTVGAEILGDRWNVHKEFWVEFGEDGKAIRVRLDFPLTEDGHKVVTWEKDKAQVWFKDKGGSMGKGALVVTVSQDMASALEGFNDPKAMIDDLYQAQSAGEVRIETQEPLQGSYLPVELTVTRVGSPSERKVYLVDSRTKLLKQIDAYKVEDGTDCKLVSSLVIMDYDKPSDPRLFRPDFPADIVKIDQTTQVIGLAKGDMSDNEIATKVTRGFFEALIAKDYAMAGQLLSGLPADRMEKMFKGKQFIRIVSVGEPYVQPMPGVGGVVVPCEVEVEGVGKKGVQEFKVAVRAVYGAKPERWTIHGGI